MKREKQKKKQMKFFKVRTVEHDQGDPVPAADAEQTPSIQTDLKEVLTATQI